MKKFKQFFLNINLKNVSKGTTVRTVMMILVIINYALSAFGVQVIDYDANEIGTIITVAITVIVFIQAWWKNNSFTKAAQLADEELTKLKNEETE